MASLEKKNLYEPEVMEEFKSRLNRITPDTVPKWGEMTAAQMLSHCAEIQEVMNGKPLTKKTPFLLKLLTGMIRNFVVNKQPYRKSMQTHPQYKVIEDLDFDTEKQRFLDALEVFLNLRENAPTHPMFGEMTEIERGWGMYKHHEHHLQQFGV